MLALRRGTLSTKELLIAPSLLVDQGRQPRCNYSGLFTILFVPAGSLVLLSHRRSLPEYATAPVASQDALVHLACEPGCSRPLIANIHFFASQTTDAK